MLYIEDEKAKEIIANAIKKYEGYFDEPFPILEHLEEVVTIEDALKLEKTINRTIVTDKPINVSKDYEKRLY